MPFQMRDETAGINILYIDNLGQLGLGSLPTSGQQLTVQGTSLVDTSGNLAAGIMGPGSQSGFEGVVAAGSYSAVVNISANQQPITTFPNAGLPGSAIQATSITPTQVVFSIPSTSEQVPYSIW